jgi:SPP1 gp7 family putative phage head morphogenesis protein
MVTRVGQTTRGHVRRVVTAGLDSGATIAEMQEGLMANPAFGPSRALTIARTETTRAVSGGTDYALQAAADEGIIVKRQWLSARDAAVRDSHREMDGQEVAVGERFVSPGGRKASHPGGFGIPGEDINCRCTVLPVVD